MTTTVNAGARLDRLPVSSFHYRIFWLIGAGMFFDGFDIYLASSVLAATTQTKFSTLPQNLQFISLTLVGMTIGGLVTGFLGDRFGRRFTYQFNLLVFGRLASLAAAFAQDMTQLIVCRFVQGLGLGAEIVVGYSTLTEFVPPKSRGRWLAFMSFLVVTGFPVTALLGYLVIPAFGWRPMFVVSGVGALVVWYLRKRLPESPRWLESKGWTAEAEALMLSIEKEVAAGAALPPPAARSTPRRHGHGNAQAAALQRMVVGSWVLITINTLVFCFAIFLPQFFLRQGPTISQSLGYTVALRWARWSVRGRRVGGGRHRAASEHHRRLDRDHRHRLDLCPVQRRLRSGDRAERRLRADRRDLRADRRPDRDLHARAVPDRDPASGERYMPHARPPGDGVLAVHRGRADGELQPSWRHRPDDRAAGGPDRRCLGVGHRAREAPPGRDRARRDSGLSIRRKA
jgi:MFS family permease